MESYENFCKEVEKRFIVKSFHISEYVDYVKAMAQNLIYNYSLFVDKGLKGEFEEAAKLYLNFELPEHREKRVVFFNSNTGLIKALEKFEKENYDPFE